MMTNVSSFIKSFISTFATSTAKAQNPNRSAAVRIGPQRVIFTARLIGVGGDTALGHGSLGAPCGDYTWQKADEELVSIRLVQASGNPAMGRRLEKRVTLKVRPETRLLVVTFCDESENIFKTEKVRIK